MKTSPEVLERRVREAFPDALFETGPEELRRILERRARGERVALTDQPRGSLWRYGVIAAGVAASLLLIPRNPTGHPKASPQSEGIGALAEVSLMPSELLAQGAARPSFPVASLDGRDIRPGQWTYAMLRHGEPFTDTLARQVMRLERIDYRGHPAWLVLTRSEPWTLPPVWKDTTWVDSSSLELLARSTSVMGGKGRVTEEYREHEVLKGFTIGGSTTWTVISADTANHDLSAGISLRGDVLFMVLKRAPLTADWRGSIQLLATPIYNRAARLWYDLAVVGEEKVVVPAGTFDCWKIRFGPPRIDLSYGIFLWVSKDKQWMIQQGIVAAKGDEFKMVMVSGQEE